jgi:hypothetical protein
MLANRLNYESDRIMQAIATGGLTPQEGKLYLDAVCRDEVQRIQRQQMVTRTDLVIGDDDIDRRHDWATREAWNTIAKRGLNVQLTSDDIAKLKAGAQDHATQWLWTYNNDRPNMGIGGITPAQKLKMAA